MAASWVFFLLAVCFWSFAEGDTWCVAKSNISDKKLQAALDYACGAGADCLPIQASGHCFLPNTVRAHASYAFNSYYQKNNRAPGSCDFAGVAVVVLADPSYGSCAYPSSSGTAGVTIPSPSLTPVVNNPSAPPGTTTISGGGGVLTPGGSTVPNTNDESAASLPSSSLVLLSLVSAMLLLAVI